MFEVTVRSWGSAPIGELRAQSLAVWWVDLDDPAHDVGAFARALDATEYARAERLKTTALRRRFIVRRGILRNLLASSLGWPVAAIRYDVGEFGKLRLAAPMPRRPLFFNVADAESMAVFALTHVGEIGVDVEQPAPFEDILRVAKRWFSTREQQDLATLPADQQCVGFYTAWTRKEAIVKALGRGIGYPLERFSVELLPDRPVRLLEAEDEGVQTLRLTDLPLPSPYIGACAVQPISR